MKRLVPGSLTELYMFDEALLILSIDWAKRPPNTLTRQYATGAFQDNTANFNKPNEDCFFFFFSPFNNNIFQRKDAKLSWETDGKNGVSTSSININWVNMTSYQYSHLRWDLKKKCFVYHRRGAVRYYSDRNMTAKKLNYSCKVLIYNQSMGWEFEHSMHMCNVQILNP